jgi:predicted dehydrogenase
MSFDLRHMPAPPARKDYAIGVIGAGFIVRDVHLVAYAKAGYDVRAICGAPPEQGREVAALRNIPTAYDTYQQLLEDPSLEIIDIAVPPHLQLGVIEAAVRRPNIRGILAQKPLAMDYSEAVKIVDLCRAYGKVLAVNQNMRYDQSIRAVKTLLSRGDLGEPVLGTIEMRAIPHWQTWLREYGGKLTIHAMGIHHLDCFRFLFGDPESVYVSARTDPRTTFPHRDGIVLSILEYANGMRASAWDDVWAGPAREGGAPDIFIRWRVEGTEGMAQGTIGWPSYPNATPSTIRFTSRRVQPGVWFEPHWNEVWFPDAFMGTMGELMDAITENRPPAISGDDNLMTMALIDACYKSLDEHRPVFIKEIAK